MLTVSAPACRGQAGPGGDHGLLHRHLRTAGAARPAGGHRATVGRVPEDPARAGLRVVLVAPATRLRRGPEREPLAGQHVLGVAVRA